MAAYGGILEFNDTEQSPLVSVAKDILSLCSAMHEAIQ